MRTGDERSLFSWPRASSLPLLHAAARKPVLRSELMTFRMDGHERFAQGRGGYGAKHSPVRRIQ